MQLGMTGLPVNSTQKLRPQETTEFAWELRGRNGQREGKGRAKAEGKAGGRLTAFLDGKLSPKDPSLF